MSGIPPKTVRNSTLARIRLYVMGNCESAEIADQSAKSKKIDRELHAPAPRMVQKLLLLGWLLKLLETLNFFRFLKIFKNFVYAKKFMLGMCM